MTTSQVCPPTFTSSIYSSPTSFFRINSILSPNRTATSTWAFEVLHQMHVALWQMSYVPFVSLWCISVTAASTSAHCLIRSAPCPFAVLLSAHSTFNNAYLHVGGTLHCCIMHRTSVPDMSIDGFILACYHSVHACPLFSPSSIRTKKAKACALSFPPPAPPLLPPPPPPQIIKRGLTRLSGAQWRTYS